MKLFNKPFLGSALALIGMGGSFDHLTPTRHTPQRRAAVNHHKRKFRMNYSGMRNSERECERRMRQIAAGQLKVENGLVLS